MLHKVTEIIVVAIVVCIITGCIGLSHVRVNVPALEVSSMVIGYENKGNKESFFILVPEFYGASGAFVSLLNENLTANSLVTFISVRMV